MCEENHIYENHILLSELTLFFLLFNDENIRFRMLENIEIF